jgi:putative transposase
MSEHRRHTFKLYPSSAQEIAMLDILGACQRLYNAALEQRRFAYKEREVSLSWYDQKKEIKDLKKAFPEYKAVHTHILQGTLKRLHLAFQHFFRRVKNGETPGYPRFKPFQRYKGWDYQQYTKGWKVGLIEGPKNSEKGAWVKLHGVGQMRMRGSVKVAGGTPKTCTIQHKADGWYASIVFEYPEGIPEPEEKGTLAMGVDWGCEKLATLATHDGNSTFIPNPRHLKKAEEKLAKEQRKLSRKKRGSKNRRKQVRKVASAYRDVANKRKDGLHKAARLIVKLCALIAVEKLNVKGMTASGGVYKRGLNRSILDTSPAEFHNMLRYKAESAGSQYVEIPTRKVKPSQTCSCCGHQAKKALSERVHHCAACGFVCDRDVNAARVILSWALFEKPDGLPVPQGMGEFTLVESAGCRVH